MMKCLSLTNPKDESTITKNQSSMYHLLLLQMQNLVLNLLFSIMNLLKFSPNNATALVKLFSDYLRTYESSSLTVYQLLSVSQFLSQCIFCNIETHNQHLKSFNIPQNIMELCEKHAEEEKEADNAEEEEVEKPKILDALALLCAMGFEKIDAKIALVHTHGDANAAGGILAESALMPTGM